MSTGPKCRGHPFIPEKFSPKSLPKQQMTPTELAHQLKGAANRITQIIQGKRVISGDTALRLGHWFGTSGQFWLNLQSAYDIRMAARQAGAEIARLPVRSPRTGGRRHVEYAGPRNERIPEDPQYAAPLA